MQDYMVQDVKRYYEIMRTLRPLNDACLLEHRVAEIY